MFNNMKKILMLCIVMVMTCVFAFADDDSLPTDTFFTKNIQLNSIVYTNKGMILVYYNGRNVKETYIPNALSEQGRVKIVKTDSPGEAMQANVVYRNGKAYKVKIYTSRTAYGSQYVVKEHLTKAMIEKFDSTEELDF